MNRTALHYLIMQITHLIDSGKYDNISISDVHKAMENKRVLRFLKERAQEDIDLSGYLDSDKEGEFVPYYEEKLNDLYCGYAGKEWAKWGVKRLGLCLLLAWTNTIIEQEN